MSDFILPDIGEGIVECELLEWLVAEGDEILEDQPVAEVMTDKATVQIPAMHSGTVTQLHYQAGDIAKVHAPLFAMNIKGVADSDSHVPSSVASTPTQDEVLQATTKSIVPEQLNVNTEDFILPDIGEGIVECEIVKWLITEGQRVTEDQPIVEVMTDKALVEIPAKYNGTVSKLYYKQGDIAAVHAPLYALAREDVVAPQDSSNLTTSKSSDIDPGTHSTVQYSVPESSLTKFQGKALASPAVRRVAREQNIDIASVVGSGKKGRVMKQDVIDAANAKSNEKPQQISVEQTENITIEPIRGMKAAMAKQMTHSAFTVPHFTVSDELDMAPLIALRSELKPTFEKQGIKLSFMPFFTKALSLALQEFPIVNAQVNEDCTEIHYHKDHNIGLAVDSKIGLIVPNIKRVQDRSLMDVATELNRLVDLAREGRLSKNDLTNGTISISNVGVIGGTTATPIINTPESAIVALGKLQKLPRFDENDNVIASSIMMLSWSADHRIIDGATMVRFNNVWRSYLERPLTMLTYLR